MLDTNLDTSLTDLFGKFSPADVEAARRGVVQRKRDQVRARAVRVRSRRELRRATSEKLLAEILPAQLADGDSWHVISHGDIDSLSYLRHIIGAHDLDYCAVSTWCMAGDDLRELEAWVNAGRIDRLDLFVGEIFPSQYGDEFELAKRVVSLADGKLIVARNHSKVTLAADFAAEYFIAIESSANVNTNPRIEQTAIHRSQPLFEFYREFFDGLRSIHRDT